MNYERDEECGASVGIGGWHSCNVRGCSCQPSEDREYDEPRTSTAGYVRKAKPPRYALAGEFDDIDEAIQTQQAKVDKTKAKYEKQLLKLAQLRPRYTE